jgi:hypothetical protein
VRSLKASILRNSCLAALIAIAVSTSGVTPAQAQYDYQTRIRACAGQFQDCLRDNPPSGLWDPGQRYARCAGLWEICKGNAWADYKRSLYYRPSYNYSYRPYNYNYNYNYSYRPYNYYAYRPQYNQNYGYRQYYTAPQTSRPAANPPHVSGGMIVDPPR